jgi:GTPase involved in cell partitioning and DNA repair
LVFRVKVIQVAVHQDFQQLAAELDHIQEQIIHMQVVVAVEQVEQANHLEATEKQATAAQEEPAILLEVLYFMQVAAAAVVIAQPTKAAQAA